MVTKGIENTSDKDVVQQKYNLNKQEAKITTVPTKFEW